MNTSCPSTTDEQYQENLGAIIKVYIVLTSENKGDKESGYMEKSRKT